MGKGWLYPAIASHIPSFMELGKAFHNSQSLMNTFGKIFTLTTFGESTGLLSVV